MREQEWLGLPVQAGTAVAMTGHKQGKKAFLIPVVKCPGSYGRLNEYYVYWSLAVLVYLLQVTLT